MIVKTFEEGLVASGYTFQPECGAYVKNDVEGYLHSYLQDPESVGDTNTWNYEKYYYNEDSECDEIVHYKRFTLD